MKPPTREKELKRSFLARVESLWPGIKGSLAEVHQTCARPNCEECASGEKHLVWRLHFKEDGRRKCVHVPESLVPAVRKALENGRKIEEALYKLGPELVGRRRQKRQRLRALWRFL